MAVNNCLGERIPCFISSISSNLTTLLTLFSFSLSLSLICLSKNHLNSSITFNIDGILEKSLEIKSQTHTIFIHGCSRCVRQDCIIIEIYIEIDIQNPRNARMVNAIFSLGTLVMTRIDIKLCVVTHGTLHIAFNKHGLGS